MDRLRALIVDAVFLMCFGSLVLLSSNAFADERVNPIEKTSSSGALLSNETPGMTIVLTAEQIRTRGYRSIYEILRDLPGFTSRGGYSQTTTTVVSMDGELSQNNEKFLLFVDGVLEQDLWRRSVWLGFQYSVHFIKNITVFYGPAAARFGSNAMSGVISIETKKAEDLADGYGEVAITKDIRNNMWAVNMMVGHSYNRRTTPKLAKSLFSWYIRGRFYYSDEQSDKLSERWKLDSPEVKSFVDRAAASYRLDYTRAYKNASTPRTAAQINKAVGDYSERLRDEFLNDRANSGLFANPRYSNQQLAFNGELGVRFDNWFLRFYLWAMGSGPGLRSLPYSYQTTSMWEIRNLTLSLNHLKSELWSSGIGEKARVIHFNLSMVFQRHEIPGTARRVEFSPKLRVFRDSDASCKDPTGQNDVDCTWKEYAWTPTYYYMISSSFRVQPKLDFRLMEGILDFSVGLNAGVAYLQGAYVTSNRPQPELHVENKGNSRLGEQLEHTFLTGFLQGQLKFTENLLMSVGLRSDWEYVQGQLEVVPNCQRALFPCYRFSSPLIGRASFIAKSENRFQIRLSYGYAFLSPSNWQLFNTTISETLNARQFLPQDKHSVELNAYTNVSDKFYFTVSAFHHWVNNLDSILVLKFRQNETRHVNIGNQRTIGGRFYSFWKVIPHLNIITNVTVLYPRLDVFIPKGQKDKEPDKGPIHLTDIPFLQANVAADWRSSEDPEASQFFGSLRLNFVSSRTNTIFNQSENGYIQAEPGTTVGAYFIIHLSAGYVWIPPESLPVMKRLAFTVAVENVLNSEYNDLGFRTGRADNDYNPNPPNPGINAFFKMAIGF